MLEKLRGRRQFLLAARLFLNLPPASPHDHQLLLPLGEPGSERYESPVATLHGGREPLDPRHEPLLLLVELLELGGHRAALLMKLLHAGKHRIADAVER